MSTTDPTCPVIHFDHHSPELARDPWSAYQQLRETCPVAQSDQHGGFKVVTRYRDIVAIAKDTKTFSSQHDIDGTGNGYQGITIPSPPVRSIPVELDPPDHTKYRKLLNQIFSPAAVEARRERIEQIAHSFVDSVRDRGACDLVNEITVPIPAAVTLELLGMPTDKWQRYAVPMHQIVYATPDSDEYQQALAGCAWIMDDVHQEILNRRAGGQLSGEDLLSQLLVAEVDGEPLSDQTVLEIAFLVIVGGLDNTASLLANALLWLDDHHPERDRLRNDLELTHTAFEEFLRYFSVTQAESRTATHDTEVGGFPVKATERVFIVWASANRDPEIFDRPDEIVLDRAPNRHLGFGWGPHRCIGAGLAKEIFSSGLQAVLVGLPDYQVVRDQVRNYPTVGLAYGHISMPTTFTARTAATAG
jgi:cytochrome P450